MSNASRVPVNLAEALVAYERARRPFLSLSVSAPGHELQGQVDAIHAAQRGALVYYSRGWLSLADVVTAIQKAARSLSDLAALRTALFVVNAKRPR